jgi:hypothetical protein
MSPSRTFILRPIATTLFMAAILLAGFVGYQQLPISALPEVDYPTMQIVTFYPGASPEVMASSVTAPLERQFGQVHQLGRKLRHHASVQPLAQYRHRRAGGAAGHQRLGHLPARGPAESADLQ